MDVPTLIDPAYKALYNVLAPVIEDKMIRLASGGAATIEIYREEVGYIRALQDVLDRCALLEKERFGKRPGDKDD